MPSVIVTFDHPNGVYYSGETLNGTVALRTDISENIRGVSIKINGYAKVRWTENRGHTHNGEIKLEEYSTYDQYINSVSYVIGSAGGQPFDLEPGTYNHTFNCLLPHSLPTSYQGEHGEIKYELIVITDLPFTFDNVFKQAFTVIQPLNLNLDPTLKVPKISENWELPWCCSCCGCGKISAELTIPYGGYVPGQKIPFKMLIFNSTEKDLEKATVKLKKIVTFECRSPIKEQRITRDEIYSKTFAQILRVQRKEYIDSIELPSIPPSTNNLEQCIQIEYLLIATVSTGFCANDLNLVIPIQIGTVPLIDSTTDSGNIITIQPIAPPLNDQNYEISTSHAIDQIYGISTIPLIDQQNGNDLPPAYFSEAPPSYEMPFIPKYPIFNNLATTSGSVNRTSPILPDYDSSLNRNS